MSWIKTPWSIQRVVRRAEAGWRTSLHDRMGLAYSRLERELLFAGEHPLRFSLSMAALLLAVLALGYVLPSSWFVLSWTSWQASEQLAYFSTLWTVQATLAALVYPIVIAFVTVFLQRRPAAEAFVHLYILDSGALVAGLSSLALVVVMALQYVLIPTYGTGSLPAWVALDGFWFLVNASLTSYFLYTTVNFLRPEVQLGVIRRYAVEVALPRDVARLYSFQVLARAQPSGWIVAPRYGDEKAPQGPQVCLGTPAFRDGKIQGTVRLAGPSLLADVRLWPLRLVVSWWMRAANRWPRPAANPRARAQDWPLLILPLMPGREYRDSATLSSVVSGPPLAKWQKLLLRWAFVFKPVRGDRAGISVAAILDELEADARAAAGRPDVAAFERAYESLVGLHTTLLGAALVTDDDGRLGSWALLPDVGTFFDKALHIEWNESYRSIFQAAIGAMASDTAPVRRLCYLVPHLDGDALAGSPVEVKESALALPPQMMFQLSGWWIHRVEEQGIMDHGHHRMVVPRAPLHRIYDEVIQSFVGGWERARETVAGLPDAEKGLEWSAAPTIGRLNAVHIQETARMLLAAVSRGDRIAAEWLADVLCKWWGQYEFEHEPWVIYGKTDYLTLGHLSLDWPKLCVLLGISEQDVQSIGGNHTALQRCVLLSSIHNFWTDIRLLVVELLLDWISRDDSTTLDQSLAMTIAAGFLSGRQWRGGGTMSAPLSEMTAAGYLAAKARQYAADGEWFEGYVGKLSRFVERVKDMERPNMVSSRVYSFQGADDVRSLVAQQIVLLSALSTTDWTAGESLRRQVDVWMSEQYRSIDILRTWTGECIQHLDQHGDTPANVLTALLERSERKQSPADGLARARRGIESLRDLLEAKRADILSAEPVDPDRLQQLARFASSKGFRADTGEFPLQLFRSILQTDEPLANFTLTVQQVRKGELTRTEMDQRASNEEEYWSGSMAQQVGVVVLSDVLVACAKRDLFVPNAETYWNAVRSEAAQISAQGGHPILILDNATRPDWVWQWQHSDFGRDYDRPDDLRVWREDGHGNSYICNFNDIEVYCAPLQAGQSLLLAREAFKAVTFRTFTNSNFVNVTCVERSDSGLLVDLKLTFSRRVEAGDVDIVRLNYASEPARKAG